LSAILDEIDLK